MSVESTFKLLSKTGTEYRAPQQKVACINLIIYLKRNDLSNKYRVIILLYRGIRKAGYQKSRVQCLLNKYA